MRFWVPNLSEFTAKNSLSGSLVNMLAGLLSVLLASSGIQTVNIDSIMATVNGSSATRSDIPAGGSSTLDELLQALPSSPGPATPAGDPQATGPQSTPPDTEYFLAASLPKISGDPEAMHPVVFSYMRNTDGAVTPVTDGTWAGTINGKPVQMYEPAADNSGATTGMLALKVKESDLKNFDIVFSKDELKSTFSVDDPQLKTDAQTTLFVAGK